MSDILNRFKIVRKISDEVKQQIKIFHVFDDRKGFNVLFVTTDDKVYGFGSNTEGCCGLGHNRSLKTPQLIPELCDQSITEFIIGETFILALTTTSRVYSWGQNDHGQLGRRTDSSDDLYLKPQFIDFQNESVIQMSSGTAHALALTQKGWVYGWGSNKYGQVGCGQGSERVNTPHLLKIFCGIAVKTIFCSNDRSFALTEDGLAYSWGYNNWCQLGHELDQWARVFEPRLIVNLKNVVTVCPTNLCTYFLTKDQDVYFCGLSRIDTMNNRETYCKEPKTLKNKIKFTKISCFTSHKKKTVIVTGLFNNSIYRLKDANFEKMKFKTLFDYCSEKFQITQKSIKLKSDKEFDGYFYRSISQMSNGVNHIVVNIVGYWWGFWRRT